MSRFVIETQLDDFDQLERYEIRDTKHDRVVTRLYIADFRIFDALRGAVEQRKSELECELRVIDTAKLLVEKLEDAVDKGEYL